jgi:hypothetical protein
MKTIKIMMMALMMCLTLNLSAQSSLRGVSLTAQELSKPVTREEVNEINLRLDNIERFGRQHRTGNHLMIAGTLLSGIGSMILYNNSPSKHQYGYNSAKVAYDMYKKQNRTGFTILGIGSGLTATGLIVNIDSFRHLRNNK